MLVDRFTVHQKGVRYRKASCIRTIFAIIVLYSCIVPIVVFHVWLWIYEMVCFSTFGIPRASFRDYLILDRAKLSKLNLLQKIGCTYCSYANAFAAWAKVIANRTEIYSCAIKHSATRLGHEHQKDFHAYKTYS